MDCSPSGSSVHEIILAWILEWVAVYSSRGSSQPRDRTNISCGSCIVFDETCFFVFPGCSAKSNPCVQSSDQKRRWCPDWSGGLPARGNVRSVSAFNMQVTLVAWIAIHWTFLWAQCAGGRCDPTHLCLLSAPIGLPLWTSFLMVHPAKK